MKWAIVVLVAGLVGCYAPLTPEEYGDSTGARWDIPGHGFETTEEVMQFVAQHVEYKSDREANGKDNYWQSPGETYGSRVGDCEDYTILAMYLLHVELNVTSHMIIGHNAKEGHAWIEIAGVWWEPQWGVPLERSDFDEWPRLRERISYGEVMYRAKYVKQSLGGQG